MSENVSRDIIQEYNHIINMAEDDLANGFIFTQEEVEQMFLKRWKR